MKENDFKIMSPKEAWKIYNKNKMETDKKIYILQLTHYDGKVTHRKVVTNDIATIMRDIVKTRKYASVKH